jgi:hypothetical protein
MDDAARRNKKMFVARVARDNLKKGRSPRIPCGASSAYLAKQEKSRTPSGHACVTPAAERFFLAARQPYQIEEKNRSGTYLRGRIPSIWKFCMKSLLTAFDGLYETCKTELRRPVPWAALSICYA